MDFLPNTVYQQDLHTNGVSKFQNPSKAPSWIVGLGIIDQHLHNHVCRCHCTEFIFMGYIKGKVCGTHVSELPTLWPLSMMWLPQSFQSCLIKHGQKLIIYCTWQSLCHHWVAQWSLLNSTNCYINSWVSLPDARNCILSAVIVFGENVWQGHPVLAFKKLCCDIFYFSKFH